MRHQKIDHFLSSKTGVIEALDELVGGVIGLRNEEIRRGLRGVRTTSQELDARTTCTVGSTDGTSELNAMDCIQSASLWDQKRLTVY